MNEIVSIEVVEVWADRVVLRSICEDEHGQPITSEWSMPAGAKLTVYDAGWKRVEGSDHRVYGIAQTFGERSDG